MTSWRPCDVTDVIYASRASRDVDLAESMLFITISLFLCESGGAPLDSDLVLV